MRGGQPETAATGKGLEGSPLLGFGQTLELDVEDGLGLVGRGDDFVGARQAAPVRGGKPQSRLGSADWYWLLPFHIELHELNVEETRCPQFRFPHSAVRIG